MVRRNGTKKSYKLCSDIITGSYAIKQSREEQRDLVKLVKKGAILRQATPTLIIISNTSKIFILSIKYKHIKNPPESVMMTKKGKIPFK